MKYKKLTGTIILTMVIGLHCFPGLAQSASLVWGESSGDVVGYKVYYGTSASSPSNSVDVGNAREFYLDSLPLAENTQYFFCVTAYNDAGESPPCAPVAFTQADTTPPAPPTGLTAQ